MTPVVVFLIALFAGLFLFGRTLSRGLSLRARGRSVDELLELSRRLPEGVTVSAVVESSPYRLCEIDKYEPYLVRKDSREVLKASDLKTDPRLYIVRQALEDPAFLRRLERPRAGPRFAARVIVLEGFRGNDTMTGFRLRTGAVRQISVRGSYARVWAYMEVLEQLDEAGNEARCRFLLSGFGSARDFEGRVEAGLSIEVFDNGIQYAEGQVVPMGTDDPDRPS